MAGRGAPPSGNRARRRDNDLRTTVKSDGKRGGFDLPNDVLPVDKDGNREQWHPVTERWWESWRRSPQGVRMMTDPDWDYLLDTALMHHQMWTSGGRNTERAAEIRMRVGEFGATPAARARLRMDVEIPEEFPAGQANGSASVTDIHARRDRILARPKASRIANSANQKVTES